MPPLSADLWKITHLDFITNLAESVVSDVDAILAAKEFLDVLPATNLFCRQSEQLDNELCPFTEQDIDRQGTLPPGFDPQVLLAIRRVYQALQPLKAKRSKGYRRQPKKRWGFSIQWEFDRLRSLSQGVTLFKDSVTNLRQRMTDYLTAKNGHQKPEAPANVLLPSLPGPATAAKPTGKVWQVAGLMHEVEPVLTVASTPQESLTVETANEKAMKLAKADRSFVHKTQRQWAKAIGCSVGLVTKLPFWKETMKQSGRGRGPKAAKVVPMSEQGWATVGEQNQELQKLIKEQENDDKQRKVYKR
jgi:hypothetical protein